MNALGRKIAAILAAAVFAGLLAAPSLGQDADGGAGIPPARIDAVPVSAGWYRPNKAWVHKDADGVWQMVTDPDYTNDVGADGDSFLIGDELAAAVNVTIPGWDWDTSERRLELVDDWKYVDEFLDPQDISTIRVYASAVDKYGVPSLDGINRSGTDVTDRFDISVTGTVVKASAKDNYLQELRTRTSAMQFSMLVPFKVSFDLEESLRKDEDAIQPMAGLDHDNTCYYDPWIELKNMGGMRWHEIGYMETNEPSICIVRPRFTKKVLASESEGGDGTSIDGRQVLPGQTVSYLLKLELTWVSNRDPEKLEIVDEYDERVVPDKDSLELLTGWKVFDSYQRIPQDAYTVEWDDAAHKFTVSMDREWMADNENIGGTTNNIEVHFDAKVADDDATDTVIGNRGWLLLDNHIQESNEVTNKPTDPEPVKQDTQSDPSVDIDGKTVLLGDSLHYRVTIDADDLTDQAYPVRRLGIIDDYDEEHLTLDESSIVVVDENLMDVTSRFNIQVKDGVVYAFLKTVDTTLPDGTVLKGDPQPADLAEYAARELEPTMDPGIDQSMLGSNYQLVMGMTVTSIGDGGQVENTATQITNHRRAVSNTVTNTLTEINPYKDVTVEVGADSADGMSIYKRQTFLYQLNSSTLPANRAYPYVSQWRIRDDYDEDGDEYTGQWAVYAAEDLHGADGAVLAAKGDRIAGSNFDTKAFGGELFTMAIADGEFTIDATQRYLDLVSADGAHAQAWRAYVQFTRTKAGEWSNTFTEAITGTERPSNEVTTTTPDTAPSIDIEKFDEKSGPDEGDRDDVKDALEIGRDGTRIVFRITNTGDVPLTSLKLIDETIAGDGTVTGIEYPDGWATLVLDPGESVDVTGTLDGVTDIHTDRAVVEGAPVVECVPKDDDPFDDKPAKPVEPGTVCTDTPVSSEPDDWSGYLRRELPQTGVSTAGLVAVGSMIAVIGACLLWLRRRAADD